MKPETILKDFSAFMADAVLVTFKPTGDRPQVLRVNERFEALFGWTKAEVTSGAAHQASDPVISRQISRLISDRLAEGENSILAELECQRKDGSRFWASMSMHVISVDGGRYTTSVIRNIDGVKRLEADVQKAASERDRLNSETHALQARLLAAINAINQPLAIWDKDYRLVICNDAFAPRICARDWDIPKGTPLEEVLKEGSKSGAFVDAIGREQDWLKDAVADIRSGPIRHTTHYTDGAVYHAVSHNASNGDTLIISTDITELEQQRERLEVYAKELEGLHKEAHLLARKDVVTGLGNRRYLEESLAAFSTERAESGGEIAALHIDLDRFKHINDTMGHSAGDFVLRTVADRLRTNLRADDRIARVGGDEFVVLTRRATSETEIDVLARRLLAALTSRVTFERKECRFGASIGVARTPVVPEADLLTHSDIALYKAKEAGRGCVRSFRAADLEALQRKKTLSDDILRGLECGEFYPVYQPQIDAETGKIAALEALARWNHPEQGVVSPALFLGPAGELGVSELIDEQIFDRALAECSEAFESVSDPPDLAFNVGMRRLMSDGLIDALTAGVAYPGAVSIELLETIFMDDARPEFARRLSDLRQQGFGIGVDDFGTGRASIVALQQIGPDRLKIDRALIAPITTSESSLSLVRSIIDIGKALQIGITAEGVESADHARILRHLGCDRLQGFYFSRPANLYELGLLSSDRRRSLSVA